MYIDKKVLNAQRITFFPKLKINLIIKIWGCGEHQKKYNSAASSHIKKGIPEVVWWMENSLCCNAKGTILKKIND